MCPEREAGEGSPNEREQRARRGREINAPGEGGKERKRERGRGRAEGGRGKKGGRRGRREIELGNER